MTISEHDRARLRELAKQKLELAHTERNQSLRREWKRHNDLRPGRPMVTVELGTFQDDIIPPLLRCQGEEARAVETRLLAGMVNVTLFEDDSVTDDFVGVGWRHWFTPFGIAPRKTQTAGVGFHIEPCIRDLEEDWGLLGEHRMGVDKPGTLSEIDRLTDLFGDILPVQLQGSCVYASPTQTPVWLMGTEGMFVAMMDYPELFSRFMDRLCEGFLSYFRMLEREGCILPTRENEWVAQGTRAFTDQLPREAKTTHDVWGYLDSQESVGLSPEMFREMIFPLYSRLGAETGLLSYGCCEPVHLSYDDCFSTFRNLRKISISPWCDEDFMGDRLRNAKTVYLRKPSPLLLGLDAPLDEQAVYDHALKTVRASRGCQLEFATRDVYSVQRDPDRVRRYVAQIRRACEAHAY